MKNLFKIKNLLEQPMARTAQQVAKQQDSGKVPRLPKKSPLSAVSDFLDIPPTNGLIRPA